MLTFRSAEHCTEVVAALVVRNLLDFRQRGSLNFWTSLAVYRREARGRNDLLTAREIEALGWGDCEDWAAYLCAWFLFHGVLAVPHCYLAGPGLLHVVVLVKTPFGHWTKIDPSVIKGMR